MSKEHYFAMFVFEGDPAVCIVDKKHWDTHRALSEDDLPLAVYEFMGSKHCVTMDNGVFILPDNSKAIVGELRERFTENSDLKTYLTKMVNDSDDEDEWSANYDDDEIDYEEDETNDDDF